MAVNSSMLTERALNTPQNRINIQKHAGRLALAEKVQKAVGKTMTLEKKTCLANCLENTRAILEATNSSNIPSKTFFLDMITSVVPNLIASDLVSTQALDSKAGMISYLRFIYGTDKGTTKANDMFTNSLYTGKSDPNYTSRKVQGEIIANGVSVDFIPVLPDTIIIHEEDKTYKDDSNGNLINVANNSKVGTIDYATGAVTFDAGSVADGTTIDYEYNNEEIPIKQSNGASGVPEISLELAQLPIYAKSRKLAAYWGFDAAYDLKKQYGQEVEKVIADQAAGEIAHEIDTEICLDLYNKAGAGPEIIWSKTAPHGVTLMDHYDSFMITLTEGQNRIFGATQRVRPNWIVCGLNVMTVIQNMRNFDGAGSSNAVGPHFFGTLGGTYKCYVVPSYDPDVFVMGYKGSNFLETGYVYAPYMPLLTTDLLMPADFRGQQGYATSYGKKMINNKMYLRGRITD